MFLVFLRLLIFLMSFGSWWGDSTISWGGLYFFFLSLIYFFVILSFVVLSYFFFYALFELVFLLLFVFLVGWGSSFNRVRASYYMIFYTLVVSLPLLVSILFYLGDGFVLMFFSYFSVDSVLCVFFVFVFLVKLPIYGVHSWLPKAHVEAPLSGSMVLAGVLLKLGVYGLVRFVSFSLLFFYDFGSYLLIVGLWGGVLSCLMCLRQVDVKSLVAYSSVNHMRVAFASFLCFFIVGLRGTYIMGFSHGIISPCMFFMVYVSYWRLHSRSVFLVKGLSVSFPVFSLWWFVVVSANIGVPPTMGFFSELFMIGGLVSFDFVVVLFLFLVAFFSGVYGIYFYCIHIHGLSRSVGFFSCGSFFDLYTVFFSCGVAFLYSLVVDFVFFLF
jgi:NADH-ubiquinone oxidoreductase chain 4